MLHSIHSDLAWLPRPPDDLKKKIRGLAQQTIDVGRSVQTFASFALDENQMISLAKAIASCRQKGQSLAPLHPFRLGVIGNGTLDFLIPALVATAARHGFILDCIKGDYNQALQEAKSPESAINTAAVDAVLVALDYRGLPIQTRAGDAAASASNIEHAVQFIDAIRSGIRTNSGATCIIQTLAPPAETIFGSLERAIPGSSRYDISAINSRLSQSIPGAGDLLFDVASLAETVGLAAWHEPTLWNLAKVPFSSAFLPLYADHVARMIGALRGKSRRCLVLDLDNTVWGGVIGDDGIEGIKLAQGDAVGEAHLSLQRYALSLRDRGVVLAVSSKNDDAVARRVFREHPEMLLREHHIAVFQANWNDKATNIKSIAAELSLGVDAFVFADDNPVERNLVRQMLPEVAVPELPEDPALYARTIAAAGYFEAVAFSEEDKKRADFYQANARRVSLQKEAGDLNAYLASLDMEITFQPFDAVGRSRISQLINKSNQFNLTTRRYTEAEVAAAEADPNSFTLQIRLTDSFGDNGMISVVICRPDGAGIWVVDTWLMSCRVLGRGVEKMVLREILGQARSRGICKVVGVYRPTERNGLVKDHYRGLGFKEVTVNVDGVSTWEISSDAVVEEAPMRVKRVNIDLAKAA